MARPFAPDSAPAVRDPASPDGPPAAPWAAALGLAWVAAVFAAYFAFNHGYFAEKIGTFGRFLLGAGG